MKITTTALMAGLLALGAWTGPATAAWLQKTANTKEYQQDWKELQRQKKQWSRTLRDISATKKKEIAWGMEKRGGRKRIIELNPPLERTTGSARVVVEWFHSPIDVMGTSFIWTPTHDLVTSWRNSMARRGVPVVVRARLPGTGPEMTERFDVQRRLIQEMVLAWDGSVWGKGPAADVFRAMHKRSSELVKLQSPRDAAGIMREAGVDEAQWMRRRVRTETGKRIEEVNRRYDRVMTLGAGVNSKVSRRPSDPILLIDGRYLLVGSVVGKTRDLFRIANRIIRIRAKKLRR